MTVKLQDTLQKRGINVVLLTDLSKAIDCLSINFLTMKLHVCCYFTAGSTIRPNSVFF